MPDEAPVIGTTRRRPGAGRPPAHDGATSAPAAGLLRGAGLARMGLPSSVATGHAGLRSEPGCTGPYAVILRCNGCPGKRA